MSDIEIGRCLICGAENVKVGNEWKCLNPDCVNPYHEEFAAKTAPRNYRGVGHFPRP